MAKRSTKKEEATATASVAWFKYTVNGKTVEASGDAVDVLGQLGRLLRGDTARVEAAARRLAHSLGAWDADQVTRDPAYFQATYRESAKQHHPDRGGSAAKWKALQEDADLLKRHHGIG